MQHLRATLVATIVLLLLAGCGGDDGATGGGGDGEPVKVGGLFDLSGPNAQIGTAARDGAQAALRQANANGGRAIELVVVDAKSDQTAAVQGARRLVEQERVAAIIGPTSTPAAGAIKDYVNGRRVPLLANVGSIPGEIPPFVFKVPESDTLIARVQSAYMARQGHRRVAFLGLGAGGFDQSGRQAFEQEGRRVGLRVVAAENFDIDDTDVTAQLQRLRAARPDAILIYAAGPAAAIAQRKRPRAGARPPDLPELRRGRERLRRAGGARRGGHRPGLPEAHRGRPAAGLRSAEGEGAGLPARLRQARALRGRRLGLRRARGAGHRPGRAGAPSRSRGTSSAACATSSAWRASGPSPPPITPACSPSRSSSPA